MRWVSFVVAVMLGFAVSMVVVSQHLSSAETGILVASTVGPVLVSILWSATIGTIASRWAASRREWSDVVAHPGTLVVAMLVVGITGWMAVFMVDAVPVLPIVFLALAVGFMMSMADRRTPALLVGALGMYGTVTVIAPGMSAGRSVSPEEAIVGGLVVLATAVVALVISGPRYRWPMIAVASVAAGYVWSALAVVQFYPFSVPIRRVTISAVLGASIVALLLSVGTRNLRSSADEVSG